MSPTVIFVVLDELLDQYHLSLAILIEPTAAWLHVYWSVF